MMKNMAPPPPSDADITALVEREIGETPTQTRLLRGGAWSSAVAVSIDSRDLVVRFSESDDDFRCDQHAARFASENLPVPAVHGIGKFGEHFWCISDRMPGMHLDDLNGEHMARTLPSVAAMLIALRSAKSNSSWGYGGWDQDGNGVFHSFADQLLDVGTDHPAQRGGGWSLVLKQHAYERGVFDRGMKRLEETCTYLPADRHLIHQDTLNYNVVVQNDHISGLFDWGTAMWGDAVYDLAWFRFWNPWYPQWHDLDIPGYLEREVGIIGVHPAERMRCCLLHIGLMHIRYNAFIGNLGGMKDVAKATERLL